MNILKNKIMSFGFMLFLLITVSQNEMIYAFDENKICEQKDYPFSINLFWINKEISLDEEYIFPLKKKTEIIATLIDWAIKNPQFTVIQLWYDKTLVSQQAIDNTLELVNSCSEDNNLTTPIILKDVGSLLLVQEHEEILNTMLPVYFRIDLLRLIAIYHEIVTEGVLYAMYADLDMPAITHESLYDAETMFLLEKYGTVLTGIYKFGYSEGRIAYENNFQILSSHSKIFLDVMKTILIDSNIKKISGIIDQMREASKSYDGLSNLDLNRMSVLEQEVFTSYREAFKQNFLLLEKNSCFLNYLYYLYYPNTVWAECCVPTKKIQMPRSHFGSSGQVIYDCISVKEEPCYSQILIFLQKYIEQVLVKVV